MLKNRRCLESFKQGYELREVDKHDIKNIEKLLKQSQIRF